MSGLTHPTAAERCSARGRPRLAFVFSGQGSHWPRMGRRLAAQEPVFRDALERVGEELGALSGWSLRERLGRDELGGEVIQPAIFAVQVGLTGLWRSWGLEPDVVVGQSLGEVAAAHAAGALGLADACRVVFHRSRLMRRIAGRGRTAVVNLSLEEAELALSGFEHAVSAAGSNSPDSTVLSGQGEALGQVLDSLARRDVFCRVLEGVDIAFHSPQTEPLRGELVAALDGLRPRPGKVPIYSTVTASALPGTAFDPAYWGRNLREPFRFAAVVEELARKGIGAFLEVSPHPVLREPISRGLRAAGRQAVVVSSLRRGRGGRGELLGALGPLQEAGFEPSVEGISAEGPRAELGSTRDADPSLTPEERLARLAAAVLGLDPGEIDVRRPLTSLGMDSVLGAEITSRVESELGMKVPMVTLFRGASVTQLAAELRKSGHGEDLPRLQRRSRQTELPLSFGQERHWFLHQLAPADPMLNCPGGLRLQGRLDLAAFERAVNEIVRRHEVLRTSFSTVDHRPVQAVAARARVHPRVVDLRAVPRARRDRAARRLVAREVQRPFELTRAPLLRVALFALGDREHLAVFTMHHVVSDGWSIGVFRRELNELYAAFAAGRPSPLPELPVQYADYAAAEREWLRGERLESEVAYWRRRLAGAPPEVGLATDHPRHEASSHRGMRHELRIPVATARRLKELGAERGATLFMTLLAAFYVLLHRRTRRQDLVVGSPVANRDRAEIRPVIGCFMNAVSLRADLSGDPTFLQFLDRVRDRSSEALAHKAVPFNRLVEELKPKREPGRLPFFQVVFNFQRSEPLEPLGELEVTPVDVRADLPVKYELTAYVREEGERLTCSLAYRRDLFEPSSIASLAEGFEALLSDVAERPAARLSALRASKRKAMPETVQALADSRRTRLRRLGKKGRRTVSLSPKNDSDQGRPAHGSPAAGSASEDQLVEAARSGPSVAAV